MKYQKSAMLSAMIVSAMMSGCATNATNTQKGAGIGAVVGAIAGKATGDHDKSRYAWGAALGAIAGGAIGAYMDKQEAELKEQLADTGVSVYREGDTLRLIMPGNITFSTASASIQESFKPILDDVALVLANYDKTKLRIEGHTDSVGDEVYNQKLSVQRANSVADYLSIRTVEPTRLMTVGMGESQPITDNNTEQSRRQNRRVELSIIPLA